VTQAKINNFLTDKEPEDAGKLHTIVSEIPEGWKWVKLGDICKISAGGTPRRSIKEYWNGDIPWVKISDIPDNGLVYETEEKITKKGLENSSAKIFPKGTILFTIFATIGKVGLLCIDAATNQAIAGIEVISKNMDAKYLFYCLKQYGSTLLNMGRGAAQYNVNQTMLRNLRVPVPSLDVQRCVVARIEEITAKIEQAKKIREEALKETEKIMQTALHQTFKKVEHYGFKTLNDVCIINPSKKEVRDLPDDMEVSFVPMSAINEVSGKIENPSTRILKDVKKGYTYFKEGDVLFAKITPCMENGKSAIARKLVNGIGFGSTEFHVLRPLNEVTPEWIFYFIRQKSFRELAARFMTGSVGQQRVPEEFLRNARIPIPPIPLQKSLTNQLDKIKEKVESLLKYQNIISEKLEALTRTVLKRAFEGRL
jgi:type I restriction enzyme S subunit